VMRINKVLAFVLRAGACLLAIAQVQAQLQSAPRPLGYSGTATADSLPIVAGDIVAVHVFDIAELDQVHLHVTDAGDVPLLLIGPTKIAGLTPGEASQLIARTYMDQKFLRNAHVAITVEQYSSSSSVTIFGYVVGASGSNGTIGVNLPIFSPQPLLTVLAMAGGVSDRASHTVTIQRRDHNIKPFSVLVPNNPEVALASQTIIYPGDTIMVPRAGIVYVLGDVNHSSGVVMAEDGKISLMQALSQAGSPLPTAGLAKIMIFRKINGEYKTLTENVGEMVKGKTPDIELMAEDVIWVPFSYGKNLLVNGASIAAAVGSATASGIIYSR
jgi:polysaccharide export outer membrane protein